MQSLVIFEYIFYEHLIFFDYAYINYSVNNHSMLIFMVQLQMQCLLADRHHMTWVFIV